MSYWALNSGYIISRGIRARRLGAEGACELGEVLGWGLDHVVFKLHGRRHHMMSPLLALGDRERDRPLFPALPCALSSVSNESYCL